MVKASHSGKVVCPGEAKWIFVQDQILSILFSERRAASEKHMKDYARGPTESQLIEALETLQKAAGNELEPNDPPGAVRSVARANPEPQKGTIRDACHSNRQRQLFPRPP